MCVCMKKHGTAKRKKGITIGITGSFGTGKTTVARLFKSCGCRVLDADRISRRVTLPATAVYKKIVNCFGEGILTRAKALDRHKLAALVFTKPRLLKQLTALIHPYVIRFIRKVRPSTRMILLSIVLFFTFY